MVTKAADTTDFNIESLLTGIPEVIKNGVITALSGVDPTTLLRASSVAKPAYDKYGSRFGKIAARRTRKAAQAAMDGDLEEAREQGEKLTEDLGRLLKIEEETGSDSHWDHMKARGHRAKAAIKRLFWS